MNNNLPTGSIAAAVDLLNKENVIAYPTEAVFGVGCDPDSETAVTRLLALKQRPVDKGLILIAASFEQLKPYIDDSILTAAQRKAVFDCWPGPVTFVFLRPRQRRGGSRDVLIPRRSCYQPPAGGRAMQCVWQTAGFHQRQSERITAMSYR